MKLLKNVIIVLSIVYFAFGMEKAYSCFLVVPDELAQRWATYSPFVLLEEPQVVEELNPRSSTDTLKDLALVSVDSEFWTFK